MFDFHIFARFSQSQARENLDNWLESPKSVGEPDLGEPGPPSVPILIRTSEPRKLSRINNSKVENALNIQKDNSQVIYCVHGIQASIFLAFDVKRSIKDFPPPRH